MADTKEVMESLKALPEKYESDFLRLSVYLSLKYGETKGWQVYDRIKRIRAIRDSKIAPFYSPYGTGNPYY